MGKPACTLCMLGGVHKVNIYLMHGVHKVKFEN